MSMFEPWQVELIEECRVARLGTVARDGRPHLVPVSYALVDGRFFVSVDEKPKRSTRLARLRNIEQDPRVSLLVDRYDDDWRQLAWVRVDGEALVVERGEAWPEAVEGLRRRYEQYREMSIESLPMIVISPERVTAWRWPS
jgi:PPOX class probable F420-dependent enzyme